METKQSIREAVAKGDLVSDKIMNQLVRELEAASHPKAKPSIVNF